MNENSIKNLNYNHTPLSKEIIIERLKEKGYLVVDENFNYINNMSKICCYDNEGYKVMIPINSLNKNTKQYTRFSTVCNLENFEYNVNLHINKNNLNCKFLGWRKSKVKNHIDILLKCSQCENTYWVDFNWWKNSLKERCNDCNSKMSNIEYKVKLWLDENNIQYFLQYKFKDCKYKRELPFDFYIPSLNICIEVDGMQHYNEKSFRHFKNGVFTEDDYNLIKLRDEIKNNYCRDNNIKLLRIKYCSFYSDKYKLILSENLL